MEINRKHGYAPRTSAAAAQVAAMAEPCVGCTDCQGLCQALIEAVVLPDILLSRTAKE